MTFIFSPEVPVGATPPHGYPPGLSIRKEMLAILALAAATCACSATRGLAERYETSSSIRHLIDFTSLLVLTTTCFAIVSGVYLGRECFLGSRYVPERELRHGTHKIANSIKRRKPWTRRISFCDSHSVEWRKMVAILPFAYLCAVQYTLQGCSFVLLVSGMWVGCHVVYLDKLSVLQSFGCKVVRGPMGLLEMNYAESLVFVSFSLFGLVATTSIGRYLFFSNQGGILRLMTVYSVLGILLCSIRSLPYFRGCSFHSHHYFNSLLFMPLVSYSGMIPCFLCGISLGSFVEGCACWGVDPIFFHALSEGVDFGVLLWTSLVPLLTSSSKRRACIEFLANMEYLAGAVEQHVVEVESKMSDSARECFACLGKKAEFRRAQLVSRDIYSASKVWGVSPAILKNRESASKRAIESLIDTMKTHEGRDIVLLAYGETVLLGLMLGGKDLSDMAANTNNLPPLESLAFNDKALANLHHLQRAFRDLRQKLGEDRRRKLLKVKQNMLLGLLNITDL